MTLTEPEIAICAAIDSRRSELVKLASELIDFDTTAREVGDPPRDEAALQRHLARRLADLGAEVDLWEPDPQALAGKPLVPPGLDSTRAEGVHLTKFARRRGVTANRQTRGGLDVPPDADQSSRERAHQGALVRRAALPDRAAGARTPGPVGDNHQSARKAMKYMLLICPDPATELSEEERNRISPDAQAWVAEMEGRGVRLRGQELAPVEDATTIRLGHDEVVVADGPFAETKEQIAGFDILECATLDEAVEVAAKHPVARFGAVEVRAFHDQTA